MDDNNLSFTKPETGTSSSLDYFNSISKDLDFFFFIIDTIMISDYIPYHAKMTLDVLDGKATDEEFIKSPTELMQKEPGQKIKKLRKHSQEFIEMIFSRIVDNFQVYLVSLIREILVVKPEILHNKQPTVSIEQILKVDSIDSLLQEIIESKVSELSNRGFGNIEEWCLSRGIPIVVNKMDKMKIVEYIAIRNIIVHNRCIVDEKYVKAAEKSKFNVGDLREIEVDELFNMINIFTTLVKETDNSSIEKFGLARIEINKSIKDI